MGDHVLDIPVPYFQCSDAVKPKSGGVKMITIQTPKGPFNVWTKRNGSASDLKILMLHGGPGGTHEYFETFENFLPGDEVEFVYYDQLGCGNSDNPNDDSLWEVSRFVDEVEQVRVALGLDAKNFVLYGQSWGGILAIEYALKYQNNLKALIVSNMMSSIPKYNDYIWQTLAAQTDPNVWKEIEDLELRQDYANPRYTELMKPHVMETRFCRIPFESWPEPLTRSYAHLNIDLCSNMEGGSEFLAKNKLQHWDRSISIKDIAVPTLFIGARYDTMDPTNLEWMSKQIQGGKGQFFMCEGSHCSLYDDQERYMKCVRDFLAQQRTTAATKKAPTLLLLTSPPTTMPTFSLRTVMYFAILLLLLMFLQVIGPRDLEFI
eukprot:Colp12_sorted_trinity150504_noHs@6883